MCVLLLSLQVYSDLRFLLYRLNQGNAWRIGPTGDGAIPTVRVRSSRGW